LLEGLARGERGAMGESIELNFWTIVAVLVVAVIVLTLYTFSRQAAPSFLQWLADIMNLSMGD
jgi:Na+/H+ antiporter NhaC